MMKDKIIGPLTASDHRFTVRVKPWVKNVHIEYTIWEQDGTHAELDVYRFEMQACYDCFINEITPNPSEN